MIESPVASERDGGERILRRLRRITTGGDYVPEVDGVRFVAIAMVVVHHVNERVLRRVGASYPEVLGGTLNEWISAGANGVRLFFALSGYVLYTILSGPRLRGRPTPLREYFLRRLTRLEPPYVIVMVGIFLFLTVTGYKSSFSNTADEGTDSLRGALLASLTYSYDLIFGALPRLNPPAWSLETEVQFYVLAPLLTVVILAVSGRPAVRLAVSVASMVVWPILIGNLVYDNAHLVNSVIRYFPYFVAGFAAAEVGRILPRTTPFLARSFDAVAIVLFLLLPVWADLEHPWLRDIVISVVACAVIVAALNGHWVKRAMGNRWLAVLGGMCYSIYLVHLPVIQLSTSATSSFGLGRRYPMYLGLQLVLLAGAVMAIALPFYVLIERPCMRRDWPTRLVSRLRSRRVGEFSTTTD